MTKRVSNTETLPCPRISAALLKIQPTVRSDIKLEPCGGCLVSHMVSVAKQVKK